MMNKFSIQKHGSSGYLSQGYNRYGYSNVYQEDTKRQLMERKRMKKIMMENKKRIRFVFFLLKNRKQERDKQLQMELEEKRIENHLFLLKKKKFDPLKNKRFVPKRRPRAFSGRRVTQKRPTLFRHNTSPDYNDLTDSTTSFLLAERVSKNSELTASKAVKKIFQYTNNNEELLLPKQKIVVKKLPSLQIDYSNAPNSVVSEPLPVIHKKQYPYKPFKTLTLKSDYGGKKKKRSGRNRPWRFRKKNLLAKRKYINPISTGYSTDIKSIENNIKKLNKILRNKKTNIKISNYNEKLLKKQINILKKNEIKKMKETENNEVGRNIGLSVTGPTPIKRKRRKKKKKNLNEEEQIQPLSSIYSTKKKNKKLDLFINRDYITMGKSVFKDVNLNHSFEKPKHSGKILMESNALGLLGIN